MRLRALVPVLVLAAGLLTACSPTKLVPNAGMLRRPDGALVIIVAPCTGHAVTDVILEPDGEARQPATPSVAPSSRWWIQALDDPARAGHRGTVGQSVEVVPFEAPDGWTVEYDDLAGPVRPGVTYTVAGFMHGKYTHQATGPSFTLATLDHLQPGEVFAGGRDLRSKPVVLSRGDFEKRAADRC